MLNYKRLTTLAVLCQINQFWCLSRYVVDIVGARSVVSGSVLNKFLQCADKFVISACNVLLARWRFVRHWQSEMWCCGTNRRWLLSEWISVQAPLSQSCSTGCLLFSVISDAIIINLCRYSSKCPDCYNNANFASRLFSVRGGVFQCFVAVAGGMNITFVVNHWVTNRWKIVYTAQTDCCSQSKPI